MPSTSFDVESKGDTSPVTIVDRQAESAMREIIERMVPEHGIFGEEHGLKFGSGRDSKYMWVLDPIDGTKSYITGTTLKKIHETSTRDDLHPHTYMLTIAVLTCSGLITAFHNNAHRQATFWHPDISGL